MNPIPALSLFLALLCSQSSFAAPPRPNIIVFLADDHGQLDSTPYGATDVRTPNLQRLADAGMTFTHAFIASPSCAPSRAAMLTGLMPARNGAERNHTFKRDDVASLPGVLRQLGYERHWAFIPPRRAALPEVKKVGRTRTELDRFILARLEHEGLTPAAEATPSAWLRRASFDLTGLAPSPAELDAFATDVAARGELAYALAADRLLASPRFGERLAQDWLDAARYADTHGFNNDSGRSMWRWRDWVIDAFNSNQHYDQFPTEQFAGDLLPQPTVEQRIATGFGRNHVINSEGGIIEEEYRGEYVVDRMRTLGMSTLGLTLECCRCHDHKGRADWLRELLLRRTAVDYARLWSTEFGRSPATQGVGSMGRDHHPTAFTCFLAGAGVKAGTTFGSSDEIGYFVGEDKVIIPDFHATILHLLGIDHEKLTFYHNGINRRLTDVHGHVIKQILA